ncbi:hypothetical protein MPSEU_000402100 [Mayamaea pseudoterrestris]|nr:hypothetical protein MPSEU_000402100 [Mayamaea pseudoterrestris]
MSNAEPRRRSKASAATERLSQSVSDIEFDPNSNSNNATTSRRRPHRSPSTGKRASSRESSRNVRRNHSSDHVVAAGTSRKTTAAAGSESKKRSTRKKSSSMHADSSNTMSKNHDHLNAPNAMNSSDTKDHKPSSTLKRKKKRPTEDALHASKDTLNSSRTSSLNASREFSAAASKTSASKDSQEQERRRQRSRSRSKSSAPRGQQRRSNSRPKTNATPRSSASRRDRSTSRDSHRKTSASAGERPKRGDTITANHATPTQPSTLCTTVKSTGISSTTTMAVPVKNSNNKLYDVDRPRQRSLKKQSAHDDVSVQSNQLLLTKEQRAWKGIDDILNDDEDHDSIATRDVLPPTVAKAMQQEKEQRAINNGALPPLMNSSFSSIQTEMTNLTLNTAVTSANNYVVQPPAANDPMQAFLGSIAENLLAETCDGEHQAESKMTAATSASTVDFETENDESKINKKEMISSMSTTTSSSGSIGIQEYYAKSTGSARQQNMHDNDEQGSSEDEDRRYDPTVQAYGRASMPPKKPNQSISVDGQSVVENMPTLMDSSFSSLLSEVTDIQSIISTAKNFVVKDEPPDNDDPMSAFLGRITNGLRARQMLIEEEGVVEDDTVSNGEQEEDVLDDELDDASVDDDGDVEQVEDFYIADGHIPAEDELSGAGRSVPDEGDLSGADEDHVDEESGSKRGNEFDDENDDLHDESEEDDDDFDEPGIDAAIYPIPPNTPGGVTSLPSLSSVSTANTHLHSQVDAHVDPLAQWAASLRLELAKKMADENKLPTAEEQELAEMEIALARAAEIAAQEKNETDITRVVLDEEIIQGVTEESERERAKAAEPTRKKKVTKKGSAAPGATDNAGVKATRKAARPPPGRRKVLKKKKLPVQPLPAPAEEPEKFSAMFKEEQRPEQVPRPKQSMPVAAVKAVAKAAMPIPKSSKKEKYEQKSTLKSLKEKLKKMSFLRGKSSRRNSPMSVNVGGDEQKYFPKDNREEDEDEDASFL